MYSDGALTTDPPDTGHMTGQVSRHPAGHSGGHPGRHPGMHGIAVLAVQIRNHGLESVLVDGCALAFMPDGADVEIPDHFHGVNPELPCRLPPGNTLTMLTALKWVGVFIAGLQAAGRDVRSVHALVGLGAQPPVASPGLDASTLVTRS
jgi:hypothetical protein